MLPKNKRIFTCFTVNLLNYTYKFVNFFDSFFLSHSGSINLVWLSKIAFLIPAGLYNYKKYKKVFFSSNKYYFNSISALRFKIIELSFCFLIISFCKVFPFEHLREWG